MLSRLKEYAWQVATSACFEIRLRKWHICRPPRNSPTPKKEKETLGSMKRHMSVTNVILKKDFARSTATKQSVTTNTIYFYTFKKS